MDFESLPSGIDDFTSNAWANLMKDKQATTIKVKKIIELDFIFPKPVV